MNHRFEIKPETLGQFTGMFDIEENEIFEGDIISFLYRRKLENGVVSFAGGKFYVKNNVLLRDDDLCEVLWNREVHVVGNIYDNPELLEGKKDDQ